MSPFSFPNHSQVIEELKRTNCSYILNKYDTYSTKVFGLCPETMTPNSTVWGGAGFFWEGVIFKVYYHVVLTVLLEYETNYLLKHLRVSNTKTD